MQEFIVTAFYVAGHMPASCSKPRGAKISVEAILAVSPEVLVCRKETVMSAARKFAKLAGTVALCLASLNPANADSTHAQKKTKKPVLPPLPSGPTGPIQQQVPLDSIPSIPPQVTYKDGQLTIIALNSTLGDILRAVRKQTGAEIEIPEAKERVVVHLGPGPAREVMAELLNGSRFNYVLLGSPLDPSALTRVVLVARTGRDNASPNNQAAQQSQPSMNQAATIQPPQEQADDAEVEDANDDSADQAAEAEQPSAADQPEVKTPQQMLQEMQQRQLQLQQQTQEQQRLLQLQQQTPGQPPVPIPGMPLRPQQPEQQ
jgi:hypothetical protein